MAWNLLETKTSASASVTSRTVTFDSAPSTDELIVLVVSAQASTTFTPPAGFDGKQNSGTSRALGVFFKIAGGSEPTDYSVTAGASTTMNLIGRRYQSTTAIGSQSLILGSVGYRLDENTVSSVATNAYPTRPGSLVVAAGYSTGTFSSWTTGYGNASTLTQGTANLYIADKQSVGEADQTTLTLTGTNARLVTLVFEFLEGSQQSGKFAAIDVNSTGSGVKTDGRYYNALTASGTPTSISDARNIWDTGDTGWTVTVNDAFFDSASTGTAYAGGMFGSDVMLAYVRCNGSGDNTAQITVGGLDNAKKYILVFGGHSGTTPNATNITIGGVTKSLTAASNAPQNTVAVFYDIAPSSGNIQADFAAASTGFSMLSAFLVIEIVATGPAILSTSDDTPTSGTTLTLNGTSFGTQTGSAGVTVGGVSVTPSSWSASQIQIPITIGANKYGVNVPIVVTDSGGVSSSAYNVQIQPASGVNYVNLSGTLASSGDRITATPDLASGDQVEWSNVVGGTIGDVTVNADASFVASSGVISFDVRVNDGTGWGTVGTQYTAGNRYTYNSRKSKRVII